MSCQNKSTQKFPRSPWGQCLTWRDAAFPPCVRSFRRPLPLRLEKTQLMSERKQTILFGELLLIKQGELEADEGALLPRRPVQGGEEPHRGENSSLLGSSASYSGNIALFPTPPPHLVTQRRCRTPENSTSGREGGEAPGAVPQTPVQRGILRTCWS